MKTVTRRIGALSVDALLIAGLGAGGGAVAAGLVTSTDIKNQATESRDIAAGGFASSEVRDQSMQSSGATGSAVDNNEINDDSIIGGDMNATFASTLKGIDRTPVLRGPRGPAGPQGEPGVDGVSGFEVVHNSSSQFALAGTSFDRMAYCPYNKIAIGGGYFGGWSDVSFTGSRPGMTNPRAWRFTIKNVGNTNTVVGFKTYVMCISDN